MVDPHDAVVVDPAERDGRPRRRARYSLLSLLLFTALICLGVSHFQTSRKLDETQKALRVAQDELGYLTIDDRGKFAAILLPDVGTNTMQWRWRLYLPPGKRYYLRWQFDDVPESSIPSAPRENKKELLDTYAKPVATGEPIIVTLAVSKNVADKWQLTCELPGRSSSTTIRDPPAWLDAANYIGWGTRLIGQRGTHAGTLEEPFVLLRMRKGKPVPPNGWTVDMQPTEGLIVWIEEMRPN